MRYFYNEIRTTTPCNYFHSRQLDIFLNFNFLYPNDFNVPVVLLQIHRGRRLKIDAKSVGSRTNQVTLYVYVYVSFVINHSP